MATLRYENGPNQSTLLSVIGGSSPVFEKPYAYDLTRDLNQQPIRATEDMDSLERFKKAFDSYRSDIDEAAKKYHVPASWLFGILWAESRGRADLVTDGNLRRSYGLFQISHPGIRGAASDEDVLDPENNINMAAKFIGSLVGGRTGMTLPQVASMYGAGRSNASDNDVQGGVVTIGAKGAPLPISHAPDSANPWDVAEPRASYIMDVVRGSNTAVALGEEDDSTLGWILGLGAAATVAYFFFRKSKSRSE